MRPYRPSGPPLTAPRQRDVILRELRAAGSAGVLSTVFLYEHKILRPASRVNELRRQNFVIETVPGPGGVARYTLRSEPSTPKPLPGYAERMRQLEARELPLFAGVRDA